MSAIDPLETFGSAKSRHRESLDPHSSAGAPNTCKVSRWQKSWSRAAVSAGAARNVKSDKSTWRVSTMGNRSSG